SALPLSYAPASAPLWRPRLAYRVHAQPITPWRPARGPRPKGDAPGWLDTSWRWPCCVRGSAVTDARGRVTPGVEVEARHEAGERLHDVVPDAVPEDRAADGVTVHRHLAASSSEQDDRRGRGRRCRAHMQAVDQRVVDVPVPVRGAGRNARGRVTPGAE